jgi:serine/threonine protein kinase
MEQIGRYKITGELGRGAMGVVYRATDPNIGRTVAIKTIPAADASDSARAQRMRGRLFREARSAGRLSHPGIVTIFDVEPDGATPFIAMEFVDGPTLEDALERGGLDGGRVFDILAQAAAALDYAHSQGIVHRDIKPANIMLAPGGTAKITDFGIAKADGAESLTRTGAIVGTPHYMAPEQIQGKAVDGRADQFSLAVLAYEMLTGERPFAGEQMTTVAYRIVHEPPPPPERLNPSLGTGIRNVLLKGLAKKPESRYATCQGFIEALEAASQQTEGWRPRPRPAHETAKPTRPPESRATRTRRTKPATAPTASAATTGDALPSSGFLSFLIAALIAAGLLALIGWQASPWFAQLLPRDTPPAHQAAPKTPVPSPAPPASSGTNSEPSPTAAPQAATRP